MDQPTTGDAVAEKQHCLQRDQYLEYTGVYKLLDSFVEDLLDCGYGPINPFPQFTAAAFRAETALVMNQKTLAEFLDVADRWNQTTPRRFELDHPSPDSQLSTIHVTAIGNDHQREEIACGWSAVVDGLDYMRIFLVRNALNTCTNPLLLSGLGEVSKLGSYPTEVHEEMHAPHAKMPLLSKRDALHVVLRQSAVDVRGC